MDPKRNRAPVLGLVTLVAAVAAAVFMYVRGAGSGTAVKGLEAIRPPEEDSGPSQPLEVEIAKPEEPPEETAARRSIRSEVAGHSGCVYVVRDPGERPVADAPFALFDSGSVLLAGLTDHQGEIEHEGGGEGFARLLVLAEGSVPQILRAPLEPGRYELTLERGAVFSGWLVVDGHEPEERIELTLISDHSLLGIGEPLGLTWDEMKLGARIGTQVESGTREQGAFQFYGLSSDWSGKLRVPRRYRLKDCSLSADYWCTSLAVEGPVEGIRVELTKLLRILGRVVHVENGDPVSAARVFPKLVYADGSKSRESLDGLWADDEGRFEIALESPQIRGDSVTICPPGQEVERVLQIEPRDLTEDWNLGDIPLYVAHGSLGLDILVQDRSGEPVLGAVAATLDASSRPSEPTDESGRTVLHGLAEGPTMIRVLAIGYEVEEVMATIAPEGGELIVTMRRGTLLRLRFLTPDGVLPKGVRCTITTSEYPFRTNMTWPLQSQLGKMGASTHLALVRGAGVTLSYQPVRGDRRVVINGIKPGLPLQLLVVDRFNTILMERELAPLCEEEHRDTDIVLERGPRTLRGRVVNAQGQPLAQGSAGIRYDSLDLSRRGTNSFGRSLDEKGGFELGGIFAEHVDFEATCPGYIPFRDAELDVPIDETPIEVQLERGREALVIVEDEKGGPLDAAVWAELPGGATAAGRDRKSGQYVLDGLPRVAVTVTAMIDGTYHRKELGVLETELHIILPVAGKVEGAVTMPAGIDPDGRYYVYLMPEGEEKNSRRSWVPPNELRTCGFAIDRVLPGRYKVVLRRQDMSRIPDGVFQDLGGHTWIKVESERTTLVVLRP